MIRFNRGNYELERDERQATIYKTPTDHSCGIPFDFSALGQQSEVRVVKPYTPTLSGAEKIQLLPSLEDEIPFTPPEFSYQLYPKRYDSEFRVVPIKAARMVKPPLNRLYKSELTLGFGNYLTPLAELKINQLRSRNGTFGVALRHHSMNGKLKLNDELKLPAGFSENNLRIYGDRFMKNSVFKYQAGAGYIFLHPLWGGYHRGDRGDPQGQPETIVLSGRGRARHYTLPMPTPFILITTLISTIISLRTSLMKPNMVPAWISNSVKN